MAGKTNFYKLAYFDHKDQLDLGVNVQREIDRFNIIDSQLKVLYDVFGNGTISGWEVFDNGFDSATGISVGISSGLGIISNLAAETNVPRFVNVLPPNATVGIYASISGSTPVNRLINFFFSENRYSQDSILIANVTTSSSSVTSIDNSVKELVTYKTEIEDLINAHKHRGNPSKIDLTKEVKNKLSGARIDGISASKIKNGRLDNKNIPLIKHTNLDNAGILTHAQLDSLAASLSSDNQELLGEISSINLMKQILFLKNKYPTVDSTFYNELAIIPGVSDSSVFDLDLSNAIIDTSNKCMVGSQTEDGLSYVYTSNFSLPDNIERIILTSNNSQPVGTSVQFAINTTNSTDYDDYQEISQDSIQSINAVSSNLRVAIKFDYQPAYDPFDPYDFTLNNMVDFAFINETAISKDFHFRVRFYTDALRTNLFYTAFSQQDQEGWLIDDTFSIPASGYTVSASGTIVISYLPPADIFTPYQLYYLVIDIWDGTSFVSESSDYTYLNDIGSSICDQYGFLPQVKNFALMFDLAGGQKIRLNL